MATTPKKKLPKRKLPRPRLTRAKIAEIYKALQTLEPHPKTELHYSNSYTLVVAVALSAQATDVGVNKATKALFARVDTPQKMLDLGEEKLISYIKTIGLYKTKARNIMAMAKRLVDVYDGDVPEDRAALESLAGVGRKTANVVLNVAFGQPTMAVDTHIFRVGNRTGMAPGKNPLEVELNLLKVTPPEYMTHAHHWLILHGRYTCKARTPMCQNCIIADICTYKDKTKAVN
jgi:endonuclease-3